MDDMNVARMVVLAVSIAMLVINTLILREMFLLKARGCDCATDEWRRIFIIVAMFIFIAAFFVAMVRNFISPALVIVWLLVTTIVAWTNIFITRQFINRMKDKNCECSTEQGVFKLMNVINWIQIVIAIIVVIFVVLRLATGQSIRPTAPGQSQVNGRQLSRTQTRGRATSGSR